MDEPRYRDYPKWMSHPAFAPATLGTGPGEGTPIRYAPICVEDEDQEAYYKAQGYAPSGTPNPKMFEAKRASKEESDYVHQEYPKWIGHHLVHSRDEERALKGEAPAPPTAPVPPKVPRQTGWTPERRAAQSAKMKARHATQKAEHG
jgi:hypothetical protein